MGERCFCFQQIDQGAGHAPDCPMAHAPAGDALAAARENVARWLRCATPTYVLAEIRADRARMEAERLADLAAYEAAARAEGAAEERDGCADLCEAVGDELAEQYDNDTCYYLRDRIRARSPSSGTEAT